MDKTQNKKQIFYGWYVVGACFIIALCASCARYSISIFSPFMLEELGWSRASIGFALSLHMVIYAVGATVTGRMTDKFGARWIMVFGGFFLILGLCLLARTKSIWEFYLYYSIITAIGVTMTFIVPNSATVRKWFDKKAGLTSGIIAAGTGLGLAVITPFALMFIGLFGWRICYIITGITTGLTVIICAALFVRKDPESMGLKPDGETENDDPDTITKNHDSTHKISGETVWFAKDAMKTKTFWRLFFAYALSLMGLQGLTSQMGIWGADIAINAGQTLAQAKGTIGVAMMVMALCGVAAKLIAGHVSDITGRKPILYLSCCIQICAFIYAINIDSLSGFILFTSFVGIGYGISIPVWTPFLGDIFGRFSVATLFGFLTFSAGIIGGMGPVIFGLFYDICGSYNGSFIFSIGALCIALFLIVPIKPVNQADIP